MPERDIESLGVMGWALDAARKLFRRRREKSSQIRPGVCLTSGHQKTGIYRVMQCVSRPK